MKRLTTNRIVLSLAGLAALVGLTAFSKPTEGVLTFLMAILVSRSDG